MLAQMRDRLLGGGWVHALAMVGLVLLALGLAPSKAAQSTGMALLTLAFLAQLPRAWPVLKTDPLAQLLALWLGYFVLRAAVASWEFPELRIEQFDEVRKMTRMLLVLAVAWWVGGSVTGVLRLLVLALAGLFLAVLYYVEWGRVSALFHGNARLLLGQNVQHVGLFFATATVGWLLLAMRIIGRCHCRRTQVIGLTLWSAVFFLLVFGLVATQVRAVWIAFLCWVIVAAVYLVWSGRIARLWQSRMTLIALVLALAAATGILSHSYDTVSKRLAEEKAAVITAFTVGPDEVPMTSFGLRVRLWALGMERWSERKWFGWGPGTSSHLIKTSGEPRSVVSLAQFHNTAVEMLVRGGLVGVLLTVAILLVLARRTYVAWREGHLPDDLALFFGSALLLFVVVNLTEAYVDRQVGWMYFALFGGLAYSFALAPRAAQPVSATSSPKQRGAEQNEPATT